MNNTLGAPSFARSGSGHAGFDTSKVRPITPVNAVPGLYSFSAMFVSFFPAIAADTLLRSSPARNLNSLQCHARHREGGCDDQRLAFGFQLRA